jgi:hypothetical protein
VKILANTSNPVRIEVSLERCWRELPIAFQTMNQQRKKSNRLPGGAIKLRQTVGLQILERAGGGARMSHHFGCYRDAILAA